MASPLRRLLDEFAGAARTEREKGTYFERLVVAFLKHDAVMKQQYQDAMLFSDWARMHGRDATDIGIDVVAKIRGEDGYCAVQCKFYRTGYKIQKADIDSFLSSSQVPPFTRGLIVETTGAPWSRNAEANLDDLGVTVIGINDLEASDVQWDVWLQTGEIRLAAPKELREDQQQALQAVEEGLAVADRGKLIMACGTGKTFTSLKIAEKLVGAGGRVLFLVPSLALASQTIREWSNDSKVPLRSFAVCSDAQVGKRRIASDDVAEIERHDLAFPATTNAAKLAREAAAPAPECMTVVFSTYQSIQVLSEAQKHHRLPDFDLIICDEAHRTTGATLAGEDESNFVRVHDQDYIRGAKRLYMTATPRIYSDAVKGKADEVDAALVSMDDKALYGETLFHMRFHDAVEQGLLTDYKVIVLAVDEAMVSSSVQNRLAEGAELKLDDASKIIGCYKALSKHGLVGDLAGDTRPMQRALAFCSTIKTSKAVADEFAAVAAEYVATHEEQEAQGDSQPLACELRHVDGTMGARERAGHLSWLSDSHDDNSCRILTNVRCLSEGVDVPALDAVLFLHPRKSQIDVVQSVGRVMRKAPGKRMGYVILPIGVPAGLSPEEALADNERYRIVWQILNALRSHDDRMDATINRAERGDNVSDRIGIVAISNTLPAAKGDKPEGADIGGKAGADSDWQGDSTAKGGGKVLPFQSRFAFDEFTDAIMAKIVQKCGTRDYWENWATDIARIAERHISRITGIVEKKGTPARQAFDAFLAEIRGDLNNSITEREAIEMLAQHIITRPVFEALFTKSSFAACNPVSLAMQDVLERLDEHNLQKESESLEKFYASVRRRAAGIRTAAARQKIIVELYDKFFRNAFPETTRRMGIVYTPVEVVDFILRSVNELLQQEFGQTLGSPGVHIIDPFTGTGTFITRLLQSGFITSAELAHKYTHEIHANEIILLAYYIAAINIEAVYNGLMGGEYQPFEGICLTDTFQLHEQAHDIAGKAELLAENSARRSRQQELDIRVIVGNPPYSAGQQSANDNAANIEYPHLDGRIAATYVARSTATNRNALYDSYIRAIRWASDRIGDKGVIGFVTNAGWVDANTADGLRQCLAEEFASIHVFHLRGNARTSGELRRKERGNVFGEGTRTPIAIFLLVKNPDAGYHGLIHMHDIGDYLTREEKLEKVARFGSIGGIAKAKGWKQVIPDEHGDWLNQRDPTFDAFIAMGDKRNQQAPTLFENYSAGLKTQRDAWAYDSSRANLAHNMQAMIAAYNHEVQRFDATYPDASQQQRATLVDDFIDTDPKKISWSDGLKVGLVRGNQFAFDESCLTPSLYRPFMPQWLYYSRDFNERVYQMPRIFPVGQPQLENRVIMVPGPGASSDFTPLMMKMLPSLQPAHGTQCFPLYLYEEAADNAGQLALGDGAAGFTRRDAITNAGLAHFQAAYPGESISKEDIFYYIYGLLHAPEYRQRFADNLKKELPRIPAVKQFADFRAFAAAGRKLGDLHCNFDSAEPYNATFAEGDLRLAHIENPKNFYAVHKMKFAGRRGEQDKSTIVYNGNITLTNIPLEAYDYVVNGKSAIDWVMERQTVKTDKPSGITNNANLYATETMGDPAWPLKLLLRVITISLETMKIVNSLPALEFD